MPIDQGFATMLRELMMFPCAVCSVVQGLHPQGALCQQVRRHLVVTHGRELEWKVGTERKVSMGLTTQGCVLHTHIRLCVSGRVLSPAGQQSDHLGYQS